MIFTANQELITRLSVFLCVLLLMFYWEHRAPRRATSDISWQRRVNNLLLVAFNNLLLRLLMPVVTISMASLSVQNNWGFFNKISVNAWMALGLSFLLLDLVIYAQHRLMHKYNWLWLLHRVHHSDTEFDASTGLRFHPLEIILSMCIKLLAVFFIGPPIFAVVLFELVLNATSLFNHGNICIPVKLDRYLRYLLVTPDMHRVHHSAINEETNSNFGFNIPWWDRLFSSYRSQPQLGHELMKIGLNEFRDRRFVNILWLLKQPLLNKAEFVDNNDAEGPQHNSE